MKNSQVGPGFVLSNGSMVIMSGIGKHNVTVVLAYWSDNRHNPFVTWKLDEANNPYLGNYFGPDEEIEAVKNFKFRMR